jgi:hypothetical protein
VLVAWASIAFACGNISTLELSPATGLAGTVATVTGANWRNSETVVLHWNGADGTEVGRLTSDAKGAISGSFTVPREAIPGYYVVVATQRDEKGADAYGTPARGNFQVLPGPPPAPVPAALAVARRVEPHDGLPLVPVGAAVVLLAVAVAGLGRSASLRPRRSR